MKNCTLAGCIGVDIMCVCLAAPAWADDAQAAWDRATRDLAVHEFERAVGSLGDVIQAQPNRAAAFRCRAFAQLLCGNPTVAIDDFSRAIHLDPKDAVLYYGRGAAFHLLGKMGKAREDLTQSLRLRPNYRGAFAQREKLLLETGSPECLDREYKPEDDQWSPFDPDDEFTDLVAGSRVELDRFLEWRSWYPLFREHRISKGLPRTQQKVTDQRVITAARERESGVRCAVERRLDESLSHFAQALHLAPRDANAYALRACVYAIRRDLKAARADLSAAIALSPEHVELYWLRATITEELGEDGISDLEKASQILERQVNELEERRHKRRSGDPTSLHKRSDEAAGWH